jgi:DNA-binding NtrC family response regulator
MSHRILLAEATLTAPAVAERALVDAGYRVASVASFYQATRQLSLDCPDLVVTAIRLNEFNGLHLLIRIRAEHDHVPVILTGSLDDLTTDIDRYSGHFLAAPLDPAVLLTTVAQLLADRPPHDPANGRRWPRKHTALEARVHNTAGLRLVMTRSPDGDRKPIQIKFPSLGLSVIAVPRWSKPLEDGLSWWCGAEIEMARTEDATTWRSIVDFLN